ncbi:MAG: flagellar protein [Eubacterium sp.]|nr:flagellar protein [Eubacterium sp.]
MNGIEKQFTSIQQMTDQYLTQKNDAAQNEADAGSRVSFEEVLRKTSQSRHEQAGIQSLKFSKHASMRLENRNISLSREQNERLESGVRKAGEKGIQDSLVIVDSLAFIVNIPNKTVVTALEKSEADENIFTNIDGAVII